MLRVCNWFRILAWPRLHDDLGGLWWSGAQERLGTHYVHRCSADLFLKTSLRRVCNKVARIHGHTHTTAVFSKIWKRPWNNLNRLITSYSGFGHSTKWIPLHFFAQIRLRTSPNICWIIGLCVRNKVPHEHFGNVFGPRYCCWLRSTDYHGYMDYLVIACNFWHPLQRIAMAIAIACPTFGSLLVGDIQSNDFPMMDGASPTVAKLRVVGFTYAFSWYTAN